MSKHAIHEEYVKAGSPDITESDIEFLSNSSAPAIRRRIAENAKTSVESLIRLSNDPCSDVRIAVALNKKTPETVLNRLVCDELEDVRYFLASSAQLPKLLLQQLSNDSNPHIAQRAKRTLARLEGQPGRIVDIFELLAVEHRLIETNLQNLIQNYSRWTLEKLFEETVTVLDAIRRHLERQRAFCLDYIETVDKDSALFKKSLADQEAIIEQVSTLLMQHIDGPDFHKGLEDLSERITQHIGFSELELFAEMQKQIDPAEIEKINARLKTTLLSGKSVSP